MKRRTNKRRLAAVAVLTTMLLLGLAPFLGRGSAELAVEQSSLTDPLVEDPVGTITDTVNEVISPSPSPPPEEEPPPPTPEEESEGTATSTDPLPPSEEPAPTGGTVPSGGDQTNGSSATNNASGGASGAGIVGSSANTDSANLAVVTELPASELTNDSFASFGLPNSQFPYTPVHGPRSTLGILDSLGGVKASRWMLAKVLAPFPVAGEAHYTDDWGAERYTPSFHLHEGTDIFAARGTPVIASSDGEVSWLVSGSQIAGNMVRLAAPDGTYYIYSHLDGFGPGIREGVRVSRGQILGSVGSTGNAEGTSRHLHFEIHQSGGQAVPPVPYLDRWLEDALRRAQGMGFKNVTISVSAFGVPATLVKAIKTASIVSQQKLLPLKNSSTSTAAGGGMHPVSMAIFAGGLLALRLALGRRRAAR